jgi:flagellar hook-basal body complex protein FliE
MRVSPVDFNLNVGDIAKPGKAKIEVTGGGPSFEASVKNAVAEVNDLQNQADQTAIRLAAGDVEDVHEAMIAMQKAKLALDFTIQVRNKVIEAYQEIMRMQV